MGTRISGTSRIIGTRTAATSQGCQVRSYQSGRLCSHGECDTILSVYNPSKYCAIHAKRGIGGRKRDVDRPILRVACAHCGSEFETANPHRRFCSDRCRMAAFARRKRAAVRAENRQQEAQALQAVARADDGRDAA